MRKAKSIFQEKTSLFGLGLQAISFRKVLGKFPKPLTGLICLIIYLYIKCKYTVSVLQVYFLPSTIALFFIYLQMLLLCLNAVLYCHVQ